MTWLTNIIYFYISPAIKVHLNICFYIQFYWKHNDWINWHLKSYNMNRGMKTIISCRLNKRFVSKFLKAYQLWDTHKTKAGKDNGRNVLTRTVKMRALPRENQCIIINLYLKSSDKISSMENFKRKMEVIFFLYVSVYTIFVFIYCV